MKTIIFILFMTFSTFSFGEYVKDISGVANIAPTVSITSPTTGTRFDNGTTITIKATAADSDGSISKVEFYSGSTKLGQDATSPYSYSLSGVTSGSYTLTAKAIDNLGATKTSSSVSITVNNLPSVSITSPATGSTFGVSTSVTLAASASDSDGSISKVEFFYGNIKLGEDLSSPYSITASAASAGSYTITAKATDNLGGVTVSSSIIVNLNKLPVVSLTSPVSGTIFTKGSNITLTADASDSDTISSVQFYNGSTLLGEDFTSPYSYTWSNVANGNYSLKAKAIDKLNISATSSTVSITVNNPPTVTIISPVSGNSFTEDGRMRPTMYVKASDTDGSISKIEYFKDDVKLGETTGASGTYYINNSDAGTYVLTAKATDNLGATTTSTPVTITFTSGTGDCMIASHPVATDFILFNNLLDQSIGSKISNEADGIKVTHRSGGKRNIWVIFNEQVVLDPGFKYIISFDIKDDAAMHLTGTEVNFAMPENYGLLEQPPIPMPSPIPAVPAGYSPDSFTTKTITYTYMGGNFAQRSNLAINLKWGDYTMPPMLQQANIYLKNFSYCITSTLARQSFDQEASLPSTIIANKDFMIKADSDMPVTLEVYDMQGKKRTALQGNTNETIAVDNNLGAGIYIVHASYGDQVRSFKMIKE